MPRTSRPSFEMLETFIALIEEEGDASRAAARLGINQPSMSKRMAQLRGEAPALGAPWLQRSGKTWGMTEEGARVHPAVSEIVRRYRALGEFAEGPRGEADIAFACGQEGARTYALEALTRLRRERPAARMRISTMRGRARIDGVASGRLDLATVTHGEADIRAIARRPLHVEFLREDPLVLVAGASSRPSWSEALEGLPDGPLPTEILARLPLILPEPDAGIRAHVDRDLDAAGVFGRLDVAMEVGGWSTILDYARAGIGAGIVARSACEPLGRKVRAWPLDPAHFRPIELRLIARPARGVARPDLSEHADRFREHLIACTAGPAQEGRS